MHKYTLPYHSHHSLVTEFIVIICLLILTDNENKEKNQKNASKW